MSENPQEPREYDAVIGGENPPPVDGAVLGGIKGVKCRFASKVVEVRVSALGDALNYGDAGLDLVIKALQDESKQVKDLAVELLRKREQVKAKSALLAYLLETQPHDAKTYNERGLIRQDIGDLKGAIADFSEAMQIFIYNIDFVYNRGFCRQQLGDIQGAIKDYDRVIFKNNQYADAYLNKGICYQDLRKYQKAKDNYLKFIYFKDDSVIAYYNLGLCSYNLKQIDLAFNYYCEAIEVDPKYPHSYMERARINSHLGNYQEAIEDYDIIIQGNFNQNLQSEAYSYRASIFYLLEYERQAIADTSKAIELKYSDLE